MTRLFQIEKALTVSTYEVDFAGVVSNIAYLRWLEDLRLQVLSQYASLEGMLAAGRMPMLVETHIHYRKSITLFDRPIVRMWIGELGKVRLSFDAEIRVDGRVTTVSHQVGCIVDTASGRPTAIPDDLRERYRQVSRGAI